MAIGLRLKSTSAGEFNLIRQYLEMRSEAKKFTKAEHDVVKADARLKKLVTTHKLADAKKKMDEEDKEAFESAESAHRLLTNDFVCMKILEKMIREAEGEELKLTKEAKKGKAPKGKYVHELEEEYGDLKKDVEEEIQKVLNRARHIINGLWHHCHGGGDMAFFLKKKTYFDWRLLNYLKLRGEAKEARTKIKDTKKDLAGLKKAKEVIESHSSRKKLAKNEEVLIKDAEKFVKDCKDCIKAFARLFANSALLLDRVIGILRDEVKHDDEWIAAHQIPEQMGQMDKNSKETILKYIEHSLQEINADIVQLAI